MPENGIAHESGVIQLGVQFQDLCIQLFVRRLFTVNGNM